MDRDFLERLANAITDIVDGLEDEGDRVYLGSTNDADTLRDLRREWFERRLREAEQGK